MTTRRAAPSPPETSGAEVGVTARPTIRQRTAPAFARLRRAWPLLRYLIGLGVVAVVVWVLASHTDELSGHPRGARAPALVVVPLALVAEVASLVCFAGLQFELLKAGGLRGAQAHPPRDDRGVPGHHQLPARGDRASPPSTGSAGTGGSGPTTPWPSGPWWGRWWPPWSPSPGGLAGLALATGEGASLDLIPVLIGVLVVTVSIGAVFVYERPLGFILAGASGSRALIGRPRGDARATVDRITAWVTSVQLGWRQIIAIVLWGTANWLFDCACFAMMFLAIGSTIPWKGMLLAYGAGQLAAALPITPGGLGAVEGSITIALVAFGGAQVTTVDAVLLYRLISFWLVLVVGWMLWGVLALEVRRGRWRRQAMTAPVAAGPETDPADPPPVMGGGAQTASETWATPETEGA